MVRDYIYCFSQGVDKVFNYNFRSHGEISPYEGNLGIFRKDFSKKPAVYAYKTMVKFLGNDAKPSFEEKDGICKASWISPKGEKVTGALVVC